MALEGPPNTSLAEEYRWRNWFLNLYNKVNSVSLSADGGDMLAANNLSDLDNNATARSNLDVDQAGTDNSTDVTLAGTGDYLSLVGQVLTQDLITSDEIVTTTTRVTTTYTILTTDSVIFCNTDAGAYTATLPAGSQGKSYQVINSGTTSNLLTVAPDGAETLIGVNSGFTLLDGEALDITYDATDGWY